MEWTEIENGGAIMADYKKELPSFGHEFLGYLQIEKGVSEKTIYEYFLDLRLFFRYMVARRNGIIEKIENIEKMEINTLTLAFVEDIKRADISAYLAWLGTEKNQKDVTRRRKTSTIRSLYSYLMTMELIETNIMTKIPVLKVKKTLPKYLEAPEVEELLQAVNGTYWIRDVAMILLMTSCGLRVSEVASMDMNDIYEDSVRVLGKGNKERVVYLSARTKEALKEYAAIRPESQEKAFFLSKSGNRIRVHRIQMMVKGYLDEIGKGDLSCHKLRHTAATQMLRSGGNLREIQMVLGHESISATEIYIHVTNSDLANLANALKI